MKKETLIEEIVANKMASTENQQKNCADAPCHPCSACKCCGTCHCTLSGFFKPAPATTKDNNHTEEELSDQFTPN